MVEDSTNLDQTIDISQPSNRKLCTVCSKFVYLHQPILCCYNCNLVFHGKCLRLLNEKVYLLQQFPWSCHSCSINRSANQFLSCKTCNDIIDIYTEKFVQCKQCFKLVHFCCIKSKLCKPCLPLKYSEKDLPDIKLNSVADDFYKQQPYFSPFNCYESEALNLLPEPDMLSDNLDNCGQILASCHYYTINEFKSLKQNANCFVSINIDGFKTNFKKFEIFNKQINESKTILGYFLCETNVTEAESQPYFLEGYNKFVHDKLIKNDKKFKHKGSGLVIYLHSSIKKVKKIDELCLSTPDFECIALEVLSNNDNFIFACGYHSPSSNFDNFLELKEKFLVDLNKRKGHKSYIFGDFNVNLYNPTGSRGNNYLNNIFSNNFLPLISRATHFSGRNPTCIDHILSNEICLVIRSGLIRYSFNHHLPSFVILDINIDNNNPSKIKPRIKINEYLLKNFASDLTTICDELENLENLTAQENFSIFYDKFCNLYDKWFINSENHKNFKSQNNLRKDWITIGLAKSSEVKQNFYNDWCSNKTAEKWAKYIEYQKLYDKLIDKAKYEYFDKAFKNNQNDLKKTWRLINNILGRKRNNKLLTFPQNDASHTFNSYFVNVANNLVNENYGISAQVTDEKFMKYMPAESNVKFENCTFLVEDVKYIISNLNNNKSTYFSPRIIKYVSNTLSPLLTGLFNKCLADGLFPSELKIAQVIPLYKNKGEITEITNYRPISMLSIFSKIFEKLIYKNLIEFLDKNSTLSNSQYGFRKKHSTLHALINATENVYKSIDNKQFTLGIFVDFSKAFDTVNHSILLKKLSVYGISGNMLKLLENYISNRQQYVSYGGLKSTLLGITCGVPQGSVLGPLLFILYINDVVNASNLGKYVLFADDLNIFMSNKDRLMLYRNANTLLYEIYNYCHANKLIINYEKCCFIEFCLKDENSSKIALGILNNEFKQVDNCKFLGVFFNSKLNWVDQIQNVTKQVSKACGIMFSARNHVPQKILLKIYMSLIQPYLMYCTSLWGSSKISHHMKKLFILQKKCIRIVSNKIARINGQLQHTKPLFTRLKILNIFNIYTYLTGCVATKIIESGTPITIRSMYVVSEHSDRLITPKIKLSLALNNSFIYNSQKILNFLLNHDIPYNKISLKTFKKRLKRHLLAIQSTSLVGDDSWLPCNHDLFSSISV